MSDAVTAGIAAAAALPISLLIDAAATRLALEWVEPEGDGEDDAGAAPAEQPPYMLGGGAPVRRILVLLATVACFSLLALQYGASWRLGVVAAYATVLIACSVTDFLVHRIPNLFVYPAIVFALVVGAVAPGAELGDVLLGGAIAGGVFFAMALLPGGGLGDAKLGLFVGLALGFEFAAAAVVIGAIAGGLGAFLMLAKTRFRGLKVAIAYGPYIACGALIVMFLGGTAFVSV